MSPLEGVSGIFDKVQVLRGTQNTNTFIIPGRTRGGGWTGGRSGPLCFPQDQNLDKRKLMDEYRDGWIRRAFVDKNVIMMSVKINRRKPGVLCFLTRPVDY